MRNHRGQMNSHKISTLFVDLDAICLAAVV
jgi:hypothetical protein